MKSLSAGSEIDSWCTRCRLDLLHRIIALSQGRPARVVCQTCGSQHNYRAPRTSAKAHQIASRSAKERPSRGPRAESMRVADWEARVHGQGTEAFTRSSIDKSFKAGQLVLHKKFGEGYVTEVLEDRKVSVMFRDGPRRLSHPAS
jgi:hypothetical protein